MELAPKLSATASVAQCWSTGLVIHRTWFDSQPEGLGVGFFVTGPGLGLIMYILTTLEFHTHYFVQKVVDLNLSRQGG